MKKENISCWSEQTCLSITGDLKGNLLRKKIHNTSELRYLGISSIQQNDANAADN